MMGASGPWADMRLRAFLLLLALLPNASAHPGDEFEVISAEGDGVTVFVEPQTLVVKAERDVGFTGEAYATAPGEYAPMRNATYLVNATGPGEARVGAQAWASGFVAQVNFSVPGSWSLLVTVNGTTIEVPIEVYSDTSVRAEANALRYDLHYAQRPVQAGLYFVEDSTGAPSKMDATAVARVERWEDETKVDEEIVPLRRGKSNGEFSFEHTFAAEGSYLVRVASEEHGIGYDDLPPFKVSVLAARLAEDEPVRETPAAPVGLLLGLLALTALLRRS